MVKYPPWFNRKVLVVLPGHNKKQWRNRQPEVELVHQLQEEGGFSALAAVLLVNRGIFDLLAARIFISPGLKEIYDPFLLAGMDVAVDRLATCVKEVEKICIYGDYDVDGISSVALLVSFFRAIGSDCFYHIPKRLEDGYGLSGDGLEAIARLGAKVVITVDCGITAVDEALLCAGLGVDLIITDHHTPGEIIPAAFAVINPHLSNCHFPFKYLAGVGVAFNLMIGLRSRLREDGYFPTGKEPNLRDYLDLVALGTIADIVPLVDENRVFVKFGLIELTDSVRPGIVALKEVSGVSGQVSCGSVGFRLAPRLNAAGRLEDAALAVELLLTDDRKKADTIAWSLNESNSERQGLEQEILRDALSMVKAYDDFSSRKSIVLASRQWHPGVIGIVASRIVERYHRPTILIALQDGSGKGSGRSIPNFHLHDALHACSEHLMKFGGHKHAAGLTIDEDILEIFVERFDQIAQGLLSDADLTPELAIDLELSGNEITLEFAEEIEKFSPFGMANPEPVFMMKDVEVLGLQIVKDNHLKLRISKEGLKFEAIGFGMAGRQVSPRIDVAFSIENSIWNGRQRLQLKLRDFREATVNNKQ